jgi:TolA-binding protein
LTQEANLLIARAAMRQNNLTMARDYFRTTNRIAQNLMAAEAKYNLALIEFRMGNYKECEELIFSYINQLASYDYWLAKIFILLADNYLIQDNIFQARHTLESVIENYDGDDLRSIARAKLQDIDRADRAADRRSPSEPIEIDLR